MVEKDKNNIFNNHTKKGNFVVKLAKTIIKQSFNKLDEFIWFVKTRRANSSSFHIKQVLNKKTAIALSIIAVATAIPVFQHLSNNESEALVPAPTISSVSPNSGLVSGGTDVVLTGSNFTTLLYDETIVEVAAGFAHSLAIDSSGNLYAWGSNSRGQIGNGTTIDQLTPYQINGGVGSGIPEGTKFKAIAAGGDSESDYSLAIDTEGNLYAWGSNSKGQIGNGTTTNQLVPYQINGGAGSGIPENTKFVTVATGSGNMDYSTNIYTGHSLAIDTAGNLYAWGNNTNGQIGNNTTIDQLTPYQVNGGAGSGIAESTRFKTIDASGHSMAIDTSENLYVWGYNGYGQIGNNTTTDQLTSYQVNGGAGSGVSASTKFKAVAAGGSYSSMAIDISGNLYTWGNNTNGQIGNNTTIDQLTPYQINGGVGTGVLEATKFITISATTYCMAIDADNNLYAWGSNFSGQIGNGTTTDQLTPYQVNGGAGSGVSASTKFKAVAAGGGVYFWNMGMYLDLAAHSLAVDMEGNLYAWGNGHYGQLGNNTTEYYQYTPVDVTEFFGFNQSLQPTVSSIKFGGVEATSFTVDSDGQITAVAPPHTYGTVDITITTIDGQTVALQDGYTYKLPEPTITSITPNMGPTAGGTEVEITGQDFQYHMPFAQVSAGYFFSVALDTNGDIWTWGQDNYGQLGDGDDGANSNRNYPVKVTSGGGYKSIAAGYYHVLALDADGNVWAWGSGSVGQIGDGAGVSRYSPVKVTTEGGYSAIAATNHSMAIDRNGNIWTWGVNGSGQIGDGQTGTANNRYTPVRVTSSGSYVSVSAGSTHSMALDSNGNIWTWGGDTRGALGNGTELASQSIPSRISNGGNYRAVSAGDYHSVALDTNGDIWTWGQDNYGQLGDGDDGINANQQSPIQVSIDGGYKAIAAGLNHSMALDSNGDIWTWGDNYYGQIGDGNLGVDQYSPIKITSLGGYGVVSGGAGHSMTINSSGYILTWGRGSYGQLGNNETRNQPSPVSPTMPPNNSLASVTLGGLECTNLTVTSNTTATCTTPAHSAGTVDVTVTTIDGQTATLADGYTYEDEYINLTLDTNNLEIEVTPNLNSSEGVVSSTKHTASFTTNIPGGVVLSVSTNTNHSNLVNLTDSTKTIEPTTGSLTALSPLSNNTWGFALADRTLESNNSSSSTTWASVPNTTQSPAILKTTTTPNPDTANTTDVFYGTKINANQQAGTYMTTVVYTAVSRV